MQPRNPVALGLFSALTLLLLACSSSNGGGAPGADTLDGAAPPGDAAGDGAPVDAAADTDPVPDPAPPDATPEPPPDVAPPDIVVPPDAEPDDVVTPPDPEPDAPAPDADAIADADLPPPDTGPDVPVVPEYDCDNLPEGPFALQKLTGPMASEDIAFDPVGNVIGSNDKAIFKSPYGGPPQVFVPDLSFRAGLRYLPNGHLIVCDNHKGQLVRVDETGAKHVLLTGLSYPNGLTVDLDGWIYFSEHDANRVLRVHPFTGETTLLTDKISNPNGLTFSPDYKTLYIDGFNGNSTIYAMSISADGVPGKLVSWATGVGTGWHDGMAVDACGNVYLCDYNQTAIYRISPDGQTATKIIDGSSMPQAYLPNMQWGSGVGGWDAMSLYIPDGWNKGVFEVWVGVPSKPRPYP